MATMDAKQLLDASKQIFKAVESGESSTTILQLLAPLESVKATEELLRQSKIGVSIARLRQSKDPKISELATRLVNRWKSEVHTAGKKKGVRADGSPAPTNKGLNGAMNSRSTTGSPAPVKSEVKRESSKFAGNPEKRNTKEDGVDTNLTGDKVRDACVKLAYDGMAYMSEEPTSAILDAAQKVEVAAFEHFKSETNGEYRQKMRSLFHNLKQNAKLREDVFSGTIEPRRLVAMTSQQLKSEEKREEDREIEKTNMKNSQAPVAVKAISTTLSCGRCKGMKVSYTEAQTRSADEPLTMFCECTICGNIWRMG